MEMSDALMSIHVPMAARLRMWRETAARLAARVGELERENKRLSATLNAAFDDLLAAEPWRIVYLLGIRSDGRGEAVGIRVKNYESVDLDDDDPGEAERFSIGFA